MRHEEATEPHPERWLGLALVTNGLPAVDRAINTASMARHTSKMAQKSKHAYLRTSEAFTAVLNAHGVKISMDGKGR